MKLFIECYPCLIKQVINTATLLKLDDSQTKSVVDQTMKYLLQNDEDVLAMSILVRVYSHIKKKYYNDTSDFDPYNALKHDTNILALHYFERLEESVRKSSFPLGRAISIAAMGNSIDFGAQQYGSIDIDYEISNIDNLHFSVYHYGELFEKLKNAETLLYIGDNAGEIVFDKILIREMKKEFPGIEIVFAVRGRPVINDATIEDARFIGMDKEVAVVSSGSVYPGTILEETNGEFKNLFKSADVILAKGQGNFESLKEVDANNVFFLFRVKCNHIAGTIVVDKGDLILLKNNFSL